MLGTVPRWAAWLGHGALLALALGFVASVTYLPHMDTPGYREGDQPYVRLAGAYKDWVDGDRDDYEYFMHVDEPVHWIRPASIQRDDSLRFDDPYTGTERSEAPLNLRGLVHETGFWTAFAGFQEMTGVGWMDLIRFFPMVWAAVTASLLWVALRPWPGAPLAAGLVALVPTTARFLGIGFFVPIGIGLAWIACVLALSRSMATDRRVLLLTLLIGAWAFFIHLIVGFAVVLLLLLILPAQLGGERRNVLLLALGLLVPLLWFYDSFAADIQTEATKFEFLPIDFTIFDQLGIPFLVAWGFGVAMASLRPPEGPARTPVLVATLASFVVFTMLVLNVALEIFRYALYDRWHQPFALFAAVPVAYGIVAVLGWIREGLRVAQARLPSGSSWKRPVWTGGVAVALGVLCAGGAGAAIAAPGVEGHLDEAYYRVLGDDDWTTFTAAKDIDPAYRVFLTHPWKAPSYAALSAKHPHTWLNPGSPPVNGADYTAYLRGKNSDGVWLIEREITIIIDPVAPDHPAYVRHPSGAWVLDEPYVEELQRIQTLRGRSG